MRPCCEVCCKNVQLSTFMNRKPLFIFRSSSHPRAKAFRSNGGALGKGDFQLLACSSVIRVAIFFKFAMFSDDLPKMEGAKCAMGDKRRSEGIRLYFSQSEDAQLDVPCSASSSRDLSETHTAPFVKGRCCRLCIAERTGLPFGLCVQMQHQFQKTH